MLRDSLLLLLSLAAAACGTLQSSDVDETNTPEATQTRRPATARPSGNVVLDPTETHAPSATLDPDFQPNLTATAARGSPIAATPPPCPNDPTPDPVVAATEVALPSATPDPNFVPDYGATATAAVVGTVPSGGPYCPPEPPEPPPPRATPTPGPAPSLPVGSLPPLTFSAGPELQPSDLYARGSGAAGRGAFSIARILIATIGVDSTVTSATVGGDGKMPDVPDLTTVYWYDFSMWPGLGGLPGAGGNAIFAGKVAEPAAGPGVFANVRSLAAGDQITLHLIDGRVLVYRVEFNKTVDLQAADWQAIVTATSDESLTIITGIDLANRRILWARRVQ